MDGERLQTTWAQVLTHGSAVAEHFYAHLFLTHPHLRDLFPATMDVQRDRLVTALGAAVSSVGDLDAVVPFLRQLGRDHRRYEATPQDYDAVGASLLWTLERFLGEEWTPEVAQDWTDAYGVISQTMVDAAQESEATSPPFWQAEVLRVDRPSRHLVSVRLQLPPDFSYRVGESIAVRTPHAHRIWRYLTPENAPREDGTADLHVARVPGGLFSRPLLEHLAAGDVVDIANPVGTDFVLDPRDDSDDDLLMVAGSTGVAPFLALLDEMARRRADAPAAQRRVVLVHGARMARDLYADDRLTALAEHEWFTYVPVVSDDPTFPGHRGTAVEAAAEVRPDRPYRALLCGPPSMVTAGVDALSRGPHPPTRILKERFALAAGGKLPTPHELQEDHRDAR